MISFFIIIPVYTLPASGIVWKNPQSRYYIIKGYYEGGVRVMSKREILADSGYEGCVVFTIRSLPYVENAPVIVYELEFF